MKKVESIVIVGPSGAGKSTLVDGLVFPERQEDEDDEYRDRIVIPNQYTTRPRGPNDSISESTHLSYARLREGVKSRLIVPHWARRIAGNRREVYGFNQIAEDDDRLRVYSANNAFLRYPNPSTRRVLRTGLVVVATASLAERAKRLREHSPDMEYAERVLRLDDDMSDVPGLDSAEIIDTTGLPPEHGQIALRGIIDRILDS